MSDLKLIVKRLEKNVDKFADAMKMASMLSRKTVETLEVLLDLFEEIIDFLTETPMPEKSG